MTDKKMKRLHHYLQKHGDENGMQFQWLSALRDMVNEQATHIEELEKKIEILENGLINFNQKD